MTSLNGSTPYTSGYPVSRVLALHPSIDLSRTRSLEEYNRIVMGLLQVRAMYRERKSNLALTNNCNKHC